MSRTPPPRIELHLHLEGALALQDAFRLVRRHGLAEAERAALPSLYRHADFAEFLAHFGAVTGLLKEPRDLGWLLVRVRRRLARQGVLYAEVRVSPSVWERRGMDPLEGMEALCAVRSSGPPETTFIVDAVRQWGRSGVERDLGLALRYRRRGVVALGLGGDEAAAPARRFPWLAEACRAEGLPLVPHAGEALGPEEVADAVRLLGARRVAHGVAAAKDPRLLRELAAEGVHLELCPRSNFATGVVPWRRPHPVGDLFRAGVPVSLSTDDPALFATSLAKEEREARRAGLTRADLAACRAAAARAAFLPRGRREVLVRALADC